METTYYPKLRPAILHMCWNILCSPQASPSNSIVLCNPVQNAARVYLRRFGHGINFYDMRIKCTVMTLPDARMASDWEDEGDELFEKRDFEGAVECYDKVLELFPRDPEIWTQKGLALSELKRYDAIKSYDTALAYYPREIYVWVNKGVTLNKVGKQIEAVRCFDTAIDIGPQNADARCQKGVSFGLLKWLEEALECFEAAIRIDPRHATAWYNKGTTLSKLKRENEARYALDRAKKLGLR